VAHRPVVVAHRVSSAGTSSVGPASYDLLDQLARLSIDQLCLSLGVGNDFVGAGKPWQSFESQGGDGNKIKSSALAGKNEATRLFPGASLTGR
jgi:hypothetical protein